MRCTFSKGAPLEKSLKDLKRARQRLQNSRGGFRGGERAQRRERRCCVSFDRLHNFAFWIWAFTNFPELGTRSPTRRSAKVLGGAGSQGKGPKGLCREAWPPGLELGVLTRSPTPPPLSRGCLRAQGRTSTWAEPEGGGRQGRSGPDSLQRFAVRIPGST